MADFIAATEFGPGHVWLIFPERVEEDAVVYLSRDSDSTSSLGINGWQAQPYAIIPLKIEDFEAGSQILLGPDYVDYILDGEYITAKVDKQSFSYFWPSIVPAAKRKGNSVVDAPKKDKKTMQVAKLEPIVSLPREPEIIIPKENDIEIDIDDVVAALNDQDLDESDLSRFREQKENPNILFIILGSIILLVLIGLGVFYAMKYMNNTSQSGNIENTQRASSLPASPDQLKKDFALGADGWNRLINDPNTDPQRLYDLGKALRVRQGGDVDIGFEAIYRSSQKSNKDALLWYARANDPTLDAQGVDKLEPQNIRRAFENWTILAEQDPSLRKHVKKLCDSLRDKRFSGTIEERTTFQDYCQ